MSTTEGKPQESAAEQAKRHYDSSMKIVEGLAAELATMTDDRTPNDDIRTVAALGQFAATTALAAATRLAVEQADWTPTTGGPYDGYAGTYAHDAACNVSHVPGPYPCPPPAEVGTPADVAAEAASEARKLGYGRGFEAGVAEGLRQAAEAETGTPVVLDVAGRVAHNARLRRAERDATRSGYLDTGDEVGGPWDDDEGPGFPRSRFGGAE